VLEQFLNRYLGNKDNCIKFIKSNLNKIDTPLLIEILKILQEELKKRINDYENKKIK
jgi:hypothetical protein